MIDISMQRFGKLIAIRQVDSSNGALWLCRCDCGKEIIKKATRLRYVAKKYLGEFVSCGCTHNFKTHGLSYTRLYKIYRGILKRCFQENCKSYKNYGGRGITICTEWKNSFLEFRKWALNSEYKDGLTIERKDVDGNYCPDNCTWIPKSLQNKNTKIVRLITFNGQTLPLSEWSRLKGIHRSTLILRLNAGWTIEDALTIQAFHGRNSRAQCL